MPKRYGLHIIKDFPEPEEACFCGNEKSYAACCQMSIVHTVGDGEPMLIESVAGVEIYRPRMASEVAVKNKGESSFRERFKPGIYKKFKEVQKILHQRVAFFGDEFDKLIPDLASRDLIEFVLWQYDKTGVLDQYQRQGKLFGDALIWWVQKGPTHRRALKYIAERVTMLAPGDVDRPMPSMDLFDKAFICAEKLIEYCITSDLTRIFQTGTTVTVRPEGAEVFIEHEIDNTEIDKYQKRVQVDTKRRSELFQDDDFESNLSEHSKYLDAPLRQSIGLGWSESLNILYNIIQNSRPAPNDPMGVKFISYERLVDGMGNSFDKSRETIEKLISGFSLRKDRLLVRAGGDDDYWNPTFEHRAYRRALFEMPHSTGAHLAFCDRMFMESFRILSGEVCYNEFPSEWMTEDINAALGTIAEKKGAWFEKKVQEQLVSIGVVGVASRTSIGSGNKSLNLPGEFDFLGWSFRDRSLVLLEDKMLRPGSEPRLWKNQIEAFLEGADGEESFVQKLTRKSDWVASNAPAVCEALKIEGVGVDAIPDKLLSAFICYSPHPVSYLLNEFPCVALSELLDSYKVNDQWIFTQGIRLL